MHILWKIPIGQHTPEHMHRLEVLMKGQGEHEGEDQRRFNAQRLFCHKRKHLTLKQLALAKERREQEERRRPRAQRSGAKVVEYNEERLAERGAGGSDSEGGERPFFEDSESGYSNRAGSSDGEESDSSDSDSSDSSNSSGDDSGFEDWDKVGDNWVVWAADKEHPTEFKRLDRDW